MYPETRLRRLRKSARVRALVREHELDCADFIFPLFIVPGIKICREIAAMPGQYQYSLDRLPEILDQIKSVGIYTLLLFFQTDIKDEKGQNAYAEASIANLAIKLIKESYPQFTVITDICLCSYTEHGHCGPINHGQVDNDETLEIIGKMALMHAKAGADLVAPSGMMDGGVACIRRILDEAGCSDTGILAYSVKYASAFYGPFREAADSAPKNSDRKSYQMDPANTREALREAELDVLEGADMLMVKPGMPYLDIITKLHSNFNLPVIAYQVSGEYSMIKAAAEKGWIDEKAVVLESLLAFKRAGATAIITYFALDAAVWLQSN